MLPGHRRARSGYAPSIWHGPLPWPGHRRLLTGDIRQLYCTETSHRRKHGCSFTFNVAALTSHKDHATLVAAMAKHYRKQNKRVGIIAVDPTLIPYGSWVWIEGLGWYRAEDCGAAAIGILLSGSGTDGTLGMKGIKEHGGFTLAQGGDGTAPQHPEMANAAIAADVVDLVMPVEEMGARLADYAARYPQAAADMDSAAPEVAKGEQAIFEILLQQVGHDFSGYKDRTLVRRIQRRVQVLQIRDMQAFLERRSPRFNGK